MPLPLAMRRLARRGLSTASASTSHRFVRAARYGLPLAGLGGAALYLSDDERRDRLRSSIFNHDAVFAQESPLIMDETTTRTELRRRYRFEKQLGVGAFGEVWLAVDSASGERVAIKLLSLTEATEPPALQLAQQEIHALRTVGRHPNVAELLRVHWLQSDGDGIDGDGGDGPPTDVALVMESANGGGLFERLVSDGTYTERRASQIVRQLALAVYHAHSRGIVHRDLKPENVCFASDKAAAAVKVIDFGSSAALVSPKGGGGSPAKLQGGRFGTSSYWAPEQIDGRPYGAEVDLWSLGLVMSILLTGAHPFDPDAERSEPELHAAVRAADVDLETETWAAVSPQARELVRSLLQRDPTKRCTAAELVSHPWVQGRNVSSRPLPQTHERLSAYLGARNAFYGSVLLAGLVSARQRNDDGTDVDVIADGWRLFDPDGKGHLTRDDLARVCSQMGVAASPADVENMLLVLSPTAALAPEPARTNMLQQLLSPERRKRLVEQILMAGLNVAPDAEEAALDDAADAAASAPPAGPVVTYERYAKTVQAAFSRSVGEGEFVFRRGDPADAVYLIKSGSCEVLRHGPLPKQQTVVMTLAPGDCCGQSAVLDGRERREASVRATSAVEVLVVGADVFRALAKGSDSEKTRLAKLLDSDHGRLAEYSRALSGAKPPERKERR